MNATNTENSSSTMDGLKWTITVIKNIPAGEELTLKYTMYVPKSMPTINGIAYLGGP